MIITKAGILVCREIYSNFNCVVKNFVTIIILYVIIIRILRKLFLKNSIFKNI